MYVLLIALRDPASYEFLKHLSQTKGDPQTASIAAAGLGSMFPSHVIGQDYNVVTSRRKEFMAMLMFAGAFLVVTAIVGLIRRKGARFAGLCLVAIVLNFGLGFLVYAEINRATLNRRSLDDAAQQAGTASLANHVLQ